MTIHDAKTVDQASMHWHGHRKDGSIAVPTFISKAISVAIK